MNFRVRGVITLPTLPGSFSEAAWHLIAGMIAKNGDIRILGVSVRPEQTALLKYLILMGAPLRMDNHRWIEQEPVADFHSSPPKKLFPVRVNPSDLPYLLQDLPALMICLACADGISEIPYAPESEPVIDLLRALGVSVTQEDGLLKIVGQSSFPSICYPSHHDLRINKAFAIATLHQKDSKHA